jgi:vitamin B12 transporter
MGAVAQGDSSRTLDEVVVTANRFPQKQINTGKVVTVIPRSVIEKSSGMNIGELLNQQAGISIAGANNTLGTNLDVYMRGAATGNALVLVDGVPAYDASTIASTFDLNQMPLDQLERIEIMRGAQSTVYGSDAVAGVINLITRQQAVKPLNIFGTLAGGSFDTRKLILGLRGSADKLSYQLSYQRLRSDGISSAHDSTGSAGFDRDRFRQEVLNAAFQSPLGKKMQWRGNVQWGEYRTDLDAGAFQDEKDYTVRNNNIQAGTGFSYKAGAWAVHTNYNFNQSERRYLNDSTDKPGFTSFSRERYTGRSHFAELYGTWNLDGHWSLLAGTDYRWQNTDQLFFSVSSFGPLQTELSSDSAKMNILSAYASAFLKTDAGFFLEGGLRFNKHSRFGNATTFSINPSFVWKEKFRFFVNLSSAFKAPSLYQLYDGAVGNLNLEAERSLTGEAGLQFTSANKSLNARAVFFAREIRDGIDFSFVDFRYFNNNRQRDYGLELEAGYRLGKWNLTGNYSFVRGEVNTTRYEYDAQNFTYIAVGDTTYNNLFRRPRHSVNLSLGWQALSRLYLRASARLVGERLEPRFMEAPLTLDAYQTFDLYLEYRVWKNQVLFFEARNLFDEIYFDVAGYNTRPRNFMGGLRFNF